MLQIYSGSGPFSTIESYGMVYWKRLQMTDPEQWPRWLCEIASNQVNFLRPVSLLFRYSIIESQESMPPRYALHLVMHRWTSHIQSVAEKREYLRLALAVIGSSVPSSTTKGYRMRQSRLLPHAERCSWWIRKICKAGWIFDDIMTSRSMHNLGILYSDQGKLNEAEEMYQRALAGCDKALGPDRPSALDMINNLGCLYSDQGKLKEAEEMSQQALAGKKKTLGSDHPSTLNTANNLGFLYRNQGKLKEAKGRYHQALAGYKKALSPDHTSTLMARNNLGDLYHNQGRLKKAEEIYQQALAGYEKALGPDHPSTLVTVNNPGNIYRNWREVKDAEERYQRALAGYEKALGPHHTFTLNTVNNLGFLYSDQGKLNRFP